jgi:hypothetical protein
MANNDDNSRRNRERPEDNPFIAFRRFADSQVSSLLNTVFTLPATIANYNNVHQAREACLFNKADKAQCDKLRQLENEIAGLRHEGRELYRVGDLQEVLKKSEELMKLDRHADELRRDIVGQTDASERDEDTKELVHRVANKKGQEWGWDWSWGFPKPFDDDSQASESGSNPRPSLDRQLARNSEVYRQLEAEAKSVFGEQAWDEGMKVAMNLLESSPMIRSLLGDAAWNEMRNMVEGPESERSQAQEHRRAIREAAMRTYYNKFGADMGLGSYAPEALEANDGMQQAGVDWRQAYEDLVRSEQEERKAESYAWSGSCPVKHSYPKRVPWADEDTKDEPSYEYSHDHEDQHDDPPTPNAKQAHFPPASDEWCSPAQSQTASESRDLQAYLHEQQHQNNRHLALHDEDPSSPEDWCSSAQSLPAAEKPHIQQFLHQQHQAGRQLGLRISSEPSETELDAYEQLLDKPKVADTPSNDYKPSILSTMTTTERTVAPDGSVTTKVVLKKRFADGREESSETVHTQRGQGVDEWVERRRNGSGEELRGQEQEKKKEGRSGWFWSS